ncbi:MAG: hypothetical protein ACYC0V_01655 [Armatimonadota bacterium]
MKVAFNISNSLTVILFCTAIILVFGAYVLISRLLRKKEKSKSDTLELIFVKRHTETGNGNADLVLVNLDDKPVYNVFILFIDEINFSISREYDSLTSGERVLVKQFETGMSIWKSAVIKYEDCFGNIHKYDQELILDKTVELPPHKNSSIRISDKNNSYIEKVS